MQLNMPTFEWCVCLTQNIDFFTYAAFVVNEPELYKR